MTLSLKQQQHLEKLNQSSFMKKHLEKLHVANKLRFKGKRNGRAIPGKRTCADGRVEIWINNHRVREHIYLMEKKLGTKIPKGYHVHHINGNPADNRLKNLKLMKTGDHLNLHLAEAGYRKRKQI